ncbi:MAG: hypothetical protein IJ088_04490 [Clostridia bacterium]|nr:hypothetical protein [Clostridia bacterium]
MIQLNILCSILFRFLYRFRHRKWNRIEHRLFNQIKRNWKERPPETYETIVSLIGSTTAKSHTAGPDLKVTAQPDGKISTTGIKVRRDIIGNSDIVQDQSEELRQSGC